MKYYAKPDRQISEDLQTVVKTDDHGHIMMIDNTDINEELNCRAMYDH